MSKIVAILTVLLFLFSVALSDSESDFKDLQEFEAFIPELEPSSNCDELYDQGVIDDGEYYVLVYGQLKKVYCEFRDPQTLKNWMVIQRRVSDEVDFYRNWENYTDGFGDWNGNFWIGLNTLHGITTSMEYCVRFVVTDFGNRTAWAEYGEFLVEGPEENYRLHTGGYRGTAGDSFSDSNLCEFSTYDKDNDKWSGNCPVERHGAWWYKRCAYSNINGRYINQGRASFHGLIWFKWRRNIQSMMKVEMKIRPL